MNGFENRFEFSVIMSVYQAKNFMAEAIASLERQTIGFDRIQLILVDDGSTDGGGLLCDEYQKKYPDQVTVIHKENGGLSSAKNAGLPHAQGRYVSFFDPDDILDKDAFQKISDFFREHGQETDICCIPIFMFGNQEGPHPLNYKFAKGNRVIDLLNNENADCFLLSSASSFYKKEVIQNERFETRLVAGEDALINLSLLIRKPSLGVVSNTRYHYRKYTGSLLNTAQSKRNWYFAYLQLLTIPILDAAEKEYGYIPRFIQNAVMYDFKSRITQEEIPEHILSSQEVRQYHQMIVDITKRLDDDVILAQERLGAVYKVYLLSKKHPADFQIRYSDLLDEIPFWLNSLKIEGNKIIIDGQKYVPENQGDQKRYHIVTDGATDQELSLTSRYTYSFVAGLPVLKMASYTAEISIENLDKKQIHRIIFYWGDDENDRNEQPVRTGIFAPISDRLDKSYWFYDNFLFQPILNGFSIRFVGKRHGLLHLQKELMFDLQLLKLKSRQSLKAVISRCVYYLLHALIPKDIWLIADQADSAGANGEAFFCYLVSHKNEKRCHPVFLLKKDSPDYERLQKTGKVIPYMSWQHKFLHLFARHAMTSQGKREISTPFLSRSLYYGDLLQNNTIIFLGQGNLTEERLLSLNRPDRNYSLFVASCPTEYKSLTEGNYGYDETHVIMIDMPVNDQKNSERIYAAILRSEQKD